MGIDVGTTTLGTFVVQHAKLNVDIPYDSVIPLLGV